MGKMTERADFDQIYETTMDGMDTLFAYVTKAKWQVVEDWTKELHALPCRNGNSLDDELKAWEDAFYPEYLEPIKEFQDSIEKIFVTGIPGIEEGTSGSAGSMAMPSLIRISPPEPQQKKLSCPAESVQIGHINADIGGCGLEGCDSRYQDTYDSSEDCRNGCLSAHACKSFSWAPVGGDKNHPDTSVCTLYNSDVDTGEWGPLQIICKPLETRRLWW